MTFQQLKDFCVIVQCESLTRAAESLYVTQPALSMTVKKMESELGVALFSKKGRNLVLTEEGKHLYEFASDTLAKWTALTDDFEEMQKGATLIRFSFAIEYVSKYILSMFVSQNPVISVSMREMRRERMLQALVNEITDVVVDSQHWEDGEVTSEFLCPIRLLVSIPMTNPLAGKSTVTLEELAGTQFMRVGRGEFSREVDDYIRSHKLDIKTMHKANYDVIKMMQSKYNFLYFLTSLQASYDYVPSDRKVIPVAGELFNRNLYVSYLAKKKKMVEPFLTWCKEQWPKME